jgi:hypothetical protein
VCAGGWCVGTLVDALVVPVDSSAVCDCADPAGVDLATWFDRPFAVADGPSGRVLAGPSRCGTRAGTPMLPSVTPFCLHV